jgi:chorismate dehydratase
LRELRQYWTYSGHYAPRETAVKEPAHTAFVTIRKVLSRLKISAISYLNTAPLMWDFEYGDAGRAFDISYTLPSTCARELSEGRADIGIIPAAAYATIPDLAVIAGVAIASRSAVRSILMVGHKPIEEIRTVALDTSSLTSVALTKILFAKWWGGAREYGTMEPDLDKMLAKCDAALLIGDAALQVDRTRYLTVDLAEEWNARTGKSFVFAFWAIRRQALTGQNAIEISEVFNRSRNHGLNPVNLEAIVEEWSSRLRLPASMLRTYLSQNIHYYLDPPCLEGLTLFYRYAAEVGALPQAPELRFIGFAEVVPHLLASIDERS